MPVIQIHFLPWTSLYINSLYDISNRHNNKPEAFPKAHVQIRCLPGAWQQMLPGKSEGKHCTEFNKSNWIFGAHPKDQKENSHYQQASDLTWAETGHVIKNIK